MYLGVPAESDIGIDIECIGMSYITKGLPNNILILKGKRTKVNQTERDK